MKIKLAMKKYQCILIKGTKMVALMDFMDIKTLNEFIEITKLKVINPKTLKEWKEYECNISKKAL